MKNKTDWKAKYKEWRCLRKDLEKLQTLEMLKFNELKKLLKMNEECGNRDVLEDCLLRQIALAALADDL